MRRDEFNKKNRRIRTSFRQLTIILFFATMIVIGCLGLLFPLRPKVSDIEKRELTKFPTFTISDFLSGAYFDGISTWYADTFPFREAFSAANSSLKKFYGITTEEFYGDLVAGDDIPDLDEAPEIFVPDIPVPSTESTEIVSESEEETETETETEQQFLADPEKAGSIYIADGRGFELFGFNRKGTDGYIGVVNTVAENLKGVAKVYDIVVPTSIGVMLDQERQNDIHSSSQEETIDYAYKYMSADVTTVPVMEVLKEHNKEYLYFNTDHHWTADGAYYAYVELMKKMGKTPSPLSDYTKKEYDGFLGSFYSYSNQSETLKNNPDTVVAYIPKSNNMVFRNDKDEEIKWYVIYDPTEYSAPNKYSCFIGGDHSWSKIENPNITDGSACVVIKESYGNCFVPFLVNNYQTVYVIDYRYYTKSFYKLVKNNNIQDVIFLNNTNALLESTVTKMYRMLYE